MLNDTFLDMDQFVCICWLHYAGAVVVGNKQLESAVLHCLCLLELALQKEVTFMDLLRESQTSLLVSPVEQLLQGVSAQSRQADHITNIARSPSSLYKQICHVLVPAKSFPPKSCQECFNVCLIKQYMGWFYLFGLHRYLYHSSSNPDAAFQSAKILRRIARYPNIQARLVGDFTHDQVRDLTLSIGIKINWVCFKYDKTLL